MTTGAEITGLFPGFHRHRIPANAGMIHAIVGGEGPPVLLLHGYPQTHVAWHRIAPELARSYTVVASDLRGYGDSLAAPNADVAAFSKERMGDDQFVLMDSLGFHRFAVVGHDRGARVGYRMALANASRVSSFVSLAVYPTVEMWEKAGKNFGLAAYHWFMLAQPFDLPERLIGADPDYFLHVTLARMAARRDMFHPVAIEAYRVAFRKESVRHAICQDYRAGAFIDTLDEEVIRSRGEKLQCPMMVLWSEPENPTREGQSPLEIWRRWAEDVRGASIPAGHLLPEEAPDEVLAELLPFLSQTAGQKKQ